MAGYALRRLLGAIPTLFIIITLTFFMMRIAPGGPFGSERRLPPEVEANVKAAYNLDKPLVQQYAIYLGKLAHGDLGPSFKNKDFTVAQLIGTGLPVSARLGLTAMALALVIGSILGSWAALRQNRWQDYSVMTLAMTGITIPTFVTAPLLTLRPSFSLKKASASDEAKRRSSRPISNTSPSTLSLPSCRSGRLREPMTKATLAGACRVRRSMNRLTAGASMAW